MATWDAIEAFDQALYNFEVSTVQTKSDALPSEEREKALKKMSTLITNIRFKVWAKDLGRLSKMESFSFKDIR